MFASVHFFRGAAKNRISVFATRPCGLESGGASFCGLKGQPKGKPGFGYVVVTLTPPAQTADITGLLSSMFRFGMILLEVVLWNCSIGNSLWKCPIGLRPLAFSYWTVPFGILPP